MTRLVPCSGPCRIVLGRRPVVAGVVPVGTPFPHVAGHVVQAVAVRRERIDRRGPEVAVGQRVLGRELALPHVHAVLAIGLEVVAPRKELSFEPTARRELPFGLRRQPLAGTSRRTRSRRSTTRARPGGRRGRRSTTAALPGASSPRRTPVATRASARPRASPRSRRAASPRTRTTIRSARRRST